MERKMSIQDITVAVRDIVDFPKPGIIFKDITPILKDGKLFSEVIDILAENCADLKPDYIVGLDARGFILGAPLATKLGCGFVPVRKKGKLPFDTFATTYELEYGEATVEIHQDALKKGDRVVIVDDLLATGGTIGAALELVKKLDAEILSVEFLMELAFLNGKEKLDGVTFNTLITVD